MCTFLRKVRSLFYIFYLDMSVEILLEIVSNGVMKPSMYNNMSFVTMTSERASAISTRNIMSFFIHKIFR